ncbi:general substrate transporter [Aspergillus pseudotamarii]|uniref:General substrate transporter n=1 Tax=Aspergillus pseudotamarii TaxID=132259 RepID=A0A5N6SN45_ASPPS|nr:general substrate transporter [Aspergillus pseudotamarii]KAE8135131.1 general substrate transporter [Aspergillus pseudotamarii]
MTTENALGVSGLSTTEAPITWKAYLVCVSAAFGGVFFGYDIGWMSGVLGMPYVIQQYTGMEYDFNAGTPVDSSHSFTIPSSDKSLMTSILSLGTFLGAIVAGDLADLWGRRITILIGCAIFICGIILQISSSGQLAVMTIGRLVAGLGVGFESSVIILYMSEVAPRKIRGAVVSAYQFSITIGLLIANCVVYATQGRNDTGSYRIPIGVQFLWDIILASALFLLPESPRYLVKKGDIQKATEALCFIREQPESSEYIHGELAEIMANHEYESLVSPDKGYINSWLLCFKGPISKPNSNIRRTIVGAGIQAMQQLSGMNFIFYYGTTFFQQLGTISNPFLISLITTLVNVLTTPLAFWTIERFGRRPLLVYGGLGMFLMQYIIGAVGTALPDNETAVKGMIAVICFQIFFYATTWGPAAWVVVGEIFSLPIRARGVAISTASCWFWNCVLAVIAPYMTGDEEGAVNLGPKVFIFWGSLCFLGALFAYFFVPEMKGLSLEQVDLMLAETSPRKSAQWMPRTTFAQEMGRVEKVEVTHVEHTDHHTV